MRLQTVGVSIERRNANRLSDTMAFPIFKPFRDADLTKRIAAVAVDVGSKRDEYRLIDPHKLAWLLGINDADKLEAIGSLFGM
jgi:hypothetical protein